MPAFQHANAPKSIPGSKTKYRPEAGGGGSGDGTLENMVLPTNILKDPRVVKGSTYSASLKVRITNLQEENMGRVFQNPTNGRHKLDNEHSFTTLLNIRIPA